MHEGLKILLGATVANVPSSWIKKTLPAKKILSLHNF